MSASVRKSAKNKSRKVVGGVKLPPIEPDHNNEIRTVLDIDPDFYSLIDGRPIRPNKSINKYKQNIKDVALKRTLYGFVKDEIIRIDREIEAERSIYETASKHFEECQHSFDKFLAYDNDKTIVVMKKSDNMAKDLANQIESHKKVSFEMASLKSKLQYIDETLLILLSLENFLHKASPILWQEKNNVKLDVQHSEITTMDSDIFHKVDINSVKYRLSQLSPPKLYFETTGQLLSIFEQLEKQNLNYLLVTEELNAEKNKFMKTRDSLKNILYEELDFIQQKIKEAEEEIKRSEDREIELKEVFFRILNTKIKYLVSSKMALEIFNYVEFAYEQLISQNDTKLNSFNMAMSLETEYDNLMLDLSVFDLDMIKQIEKETYESGEREIKTAIEASKLLKDVDKLSKRLKVSYEPPFKTA